MLVQHRSLPTLLAFSSTAGLCVAWLIRRIFGRPCGQVFYATADESPFQVARICELRERHRCDHSGPEHRR